MSDLLPCPFCGGEASFKPRSFKAGCDRCGAHVPNGAVSSDETIAAWNTRVPSQAQIDAAVRAERERIAAMIEATVYTNNGPVRSLEPISPALVGMDMHHATIAAAIRKGEQP